jgi:hypothetical protein
MIMFENRVPGKIFGPKREDVTEDYRKLHSEERHNLLSRMMRWARHEARMAALRNA